MKEYLFLHDFVKEGIVTGDIRDYSEDMIIAMFYQSSRTVVNLIFDSEPQDKNKVIEDGFQILWDGLAQK
jgi:hypothetical protein